MKEYKLKIELLEPMLGSIPLNGEEYNKFIEIAKANNPLLDDEDIQDEVECHDGSEEDRKVTGFYKDEKGLLIFDYHIKGFLKEAANILKDAQGIKAARSKIDNYVFIEPRKIYLGKQKPDGLITRPLRTLTPRGPRSMVVTSEYVAAGTKWSCKLVILNTTAVPEKLIRACLDYGRFKGLGQWRNASFGRFTYELT